ncbi:MAG: amidohydrolase [Bacteroidetes bacterium]|nr:amidohydrolase [Bacteroidota bacterium]MBS1628583.1 amidohydrolase [Bacteroidota bacterium]
MKSLDIHTHILPEQVPNWMKKFGYGDFIHLEHHKPCCARMIKGDKFFREIEENCWEPKARLKDMDETEVGMQVISTIPVLFNYWAKPEHGLETSRYFNDHIAQSAALYPERFIGIGTVPLQDVDRAIREMERCVNELKMPGLEIGSNVNNKNLSDPEFDSFWQAAEELNCALFIHPWEVMGAADMQRYWLPWLVGMPGETSRAICSLIFAGVFERFPKLRIAFAHGGGSFPFTIGRIQHGFDVRPDLCAIDNDVAPRSYVGKFWIDALLHDADALNYALKLMGQDKLCMGSDYPFPLGEHRPGNLIRSMDYPDALKQQLLWDNGMRWLGLA